MCFFYLYTLLISSNLPSYCVTPQVVAVIKWWRDLFCFSSMNHMFADRVASLENVAKHCVSYLWTDDESCIPNMILTFISQCPSSRLEKKEAAGWKLYKRYWQNHLNEASLHLLWHFWIPCYTSTLSKPVKVTRLPMLAFLYEFHWRPLRLSLIKGRWLQLSTWANGSNSTICTCCLTHGVCPVLLYPKDRTLLDHIRSNPICVTYRLVLIQTPS